MSRGRKVDAPARIRRVSSVDTPCIQGERMKEVGLRIRVDDVLRREFIRTCKAEDTTAAQVLRACMRSYVEEHGGEADHPSISGSSIRRRHAARA